LVEPETDLAGILAIISAQSGNMCLLKIKGWWEGNTKIDGINWNCIYI